MPVRSPRPYSGENIVFILILIQSSDDNDGKKGKETENRRPLATLYDIIDMPWIESPGPHRVTLLERYCLNTTRCPGTLTHSGIGECERKVCRHK